METKQWTTVDKSKWARGPWDSEPDKAQWQDEETGLPCLIVRGPSGALCGYVGLDESHPMHGKECDGPSVECHWGLTFAGPCADTKDESRHICHVPGPGEPAHVWWFGFDCAHSGDYCPGHAHLGGIFKQSSWETYRDIDYVRRQVRQLARQFKEQAA